MQGYIKLHRKIMENPMYFEEKFSYAMAWIDLLLLASHKPTKILVRGIVLDLEAGDLFYSQEELAKRWKWSRKKVNRYLNLLQTWGQITYKVHNRIGITSIINWDIYQGNGTTEDTTEEQQKSDKRYSNKNVKKDITKVISNNKGKFQKPNLEDIENYCLERKNYVDANKFFNYYESNGWRVGKNPMKDWKAAVRNWEQNSSGGYVKPNGAVTAEKGKYGNK